MGPAELEAAARTLAKKHSARIQVTSGDALAKNFPLVHAVGAGSARAPRLIDMTWGKASDPKITLVGKGVCFDTGGLDIKPDSGMLNMKKDMGGAATALALAHMIMADGLKVRLRVIIPAVENAISGTSFRPRDVYVSRKGISVEIGNTDAEGRLILADALTLAEEDRPSLVIDFATLTGAARVALGPDVPPFFTDDDALADELMRAAAAESDPLWRLPLWRPYAGFLDSKVADLNNVGTGGQAGAITAALFSHGHLRQSPDVRRARSASRRAPSTHCSAPDILDRWSPSTPALIPSGPRSPQITCADMSKPNASSKAADTRSSTRSRPFVARHRTTHGSTRKRCWANG
jgi:leucyl aminopeptidase